MNKGFKGHNYIVVYKYDNYKHEDKCKIKAFKTLEKAKKYFDKMKTKYTYGWHSVVLMDTMGRAINKYILY